MEVSKFMEEELVVLYTNIVDAKNVMSNLSSNGIRRAYLNTTEFGLHIGISPKYRVNKFPGALPSTIVKLVIKVDSNDKDNALSVLEKSFGVID